MITNPALDYIQHKKQWNQIVFFFLKMIRPGEIMLHRSVTTKNTKSSEKKNEKKTRVAEDYEKKKHSSSVDFY
jgi:hypothetical protein